jgi:hypothetical protein
MDINILKDTPPWEWPANTRQILMENLRDGERAASDRIVAAELAGDLVVMDDKMADALLAIVRSAGEPEELRAKAAISLGPVLEEMDTELLDDDPAEAPIRKKTFGQIQETLRKIHDDAGAPKEVRRRALEASVRSPQDWHKEAIRAAYSSGDEDWKLTATFCMGWIPGFDEQIVEMLDSRNPDIHFEAVCAAGEQGVAAAWPHVSALLASEKTEKHLRLAAIGAAATICPEEAEELLVELADSDDEEVAQAADDALLMAQGLNEFDDEDEEDEDSPF